MCPAETVGVSLRGAFAVTWQSPVNDEIAHPHCDEHVVPVQVSQLPLAMTYILAARPCVRRGTRLYGG